MLFMFADSLLEEGRYYWCFNVANGISVLPTSFPVDRDAAVAVATVGAAHIFSPKSSKYIHYFF